MKKYFIIFSILIFLTACATEPLIKQTTSGFPEGVFRNTSLDEASSKIIQGCSNNQFSVDILNANQIICSKVPTGKDAVIAQLLVGGDVLSPPLLKIKFILFKDNKDVKVIANQWIESQSTFGRINKVPLDANHHKNAIQKFLFSLGAE
ncbi:MAG: hypothetical protein NZ826_05035 [Thermodesulfovibrio sp.]|nr:hypothetical protein [Thermodesulfovibrio sp.]